MFNVVMVAREQGSGGGIIAPAAAEKLGWNLLDRALIGAVAWAAQVDAEAAGRYDEHVDPWWHRSNSGGFRNAAIEAEITPSDAQFFDAETMAAFAQYVIPKAATTGNCVIVGRGGQCVLQDHEDVLHVSIYAPLAERIGRVFARAESTRDVEEPIRVTGRERASYIRTYHGCDWKDPHFYHKMISSKWGTE